MSARKFLSYLVVDLLKGIREKRHEFLLKEKYPSCLFETGVQIKSPKNLVLGKNIIIQKNTILHCGGMEWSNFKGHITIGDDSVISPNCVFYGAGGIQIVDKNPKYLIVRCQNS